MILGWFTLFEVWLCVVPSVGDRTGAALCEVGNTDAGGGAGDGVSWEGVCVRVFI